MTRDKTQHGYPIAAYFPNRRGLAAIIADVSADNPDDPWAVWYMDGNGTCVDGLYCEDWDAAAEDFASRVLKINRTSR